MQREVVHDGANDRHAHSALTASKAENLLAFRAVDLVDVEPGAVVADLDNDAISVHREREVHLSVVVTVGMPHRVRTRLCQGELEIGDSVFGEAR